MAHTFTRQELYDLIWAEPMRTVAKRLGVSDVWLRKNCVAANIPSPGLGYWARSKTAQAVRKFPLPERRLGEADEIVIGRQPSYWYPQDAEIGDIPPLKTFPESLDDVRRRATKLIGRVTASRSLDKPHPVIAKLLEEDERRRVQLQERPYAWEKPLFDSPESRRQLRILNGLFLGLARAGAVSSMCRNNPIEWAVCVGDTHVSLNLEAIKEKRSPRSQADQKGRKAPVRLQLILDHLPEYPDLVNSWEDQDDKTIEQQIGDIAIAILVTGEMKYRAGLIRRHQWRVERREEYLEKQRLKKEEEERQRRKELQRLAEERRKRLVADTKAWRLAANIRAFIKVVLDRRAQCLDAESAPQFDDWLNWATGEAERIDPLSKPLAELIDYAPASDGV
jgi:hypothetical protein